MAKRSKLSRMPPSGDARSFAAWPRLEKRVDELKSRVDELRSHVDDHEERLDTNEDRLDHHEALIAEVENDLRTLRQVGERLAERELARERTKLVRRRR